MRGWLFGLCLAVGCIGSAADHERLGDTAYALAEYATALGEYRAAARDPGASGVWAKLAATAVRTGDYRDAAEAYARLAALDPSRATEAARGLELVALAASRDDVPAALQLAVDALRKLAPERVTGSQALAVMRGGRLPASDAAALGPRALAAAGDAATVDLMLVGYAEALQATTACGEAADAFQAVLRRSRDASIRARAAAGLGGCGLQLGREALAIDRPEMAARWFSRVLSVDSTSDRGRGALLGLGDARVAQGDLLGATIAYQDVLDASASDSFATEAGQRLARLGAAAATADSQ
ncbi:MAG: hypothetical protein SGJ01_05490 [Gemmatimonadota bacterium]|nr:hypothetical protein [Gemmatimonadota bacterium]